MAINKKIAEIIVGDMADFEDRSRYAVQRQALEAADNILSNDNVNAYFESKVINDQVRRLRADHRCPTCGNEDV